MFQGEAEALECVCCEERNNGRWLHPLAIIVDIYLHILWCRIFIEKSIVTQLVKH